MTSPLLAGTGLTKLQNILVLLAWLKEQARVRFRDELSRPPNYEDLAYLAGQIHDDYCGNFENPAIYPFVQNAMIDLGRFWPDSTPENLHRRLGELAGDAVSYIRQIVAEKLKDFGQNLDYLQVFKDASKDSDVSDVSLFTLNHDMLLDRFLAEDGIAVGLRVFPDGSRRWDSKAFDGPAVRVKLYKLHGCLSWHRVRPRSDSDIRQNERYPHFVGSFSSSDSGPPIYELADASEGPLILSGTFNKMLDYTKDIFFELQHRFRTTLASSDTLVVCGYGFGDKGINNRIIEWREQSPQNQILIIDPARPSDILSKARGAICREIVAIVPLIRKNNLPRGAVHHWPHGIQELSPSDGIPIVTWDKIREVIRSRNNPFGSGGFRENQSIIPDSKFPGAQTNVITNQITPTMIEALPAVGQRWSIDPSPKMFWIGGIQLCEPDFKQIVLWGNVLEIKPETVLERLLDNEPIQSVQYLEIFEEILLRDNKTIIENGKIVSLFWRFALLPLRNFKWVEGLEIEVLCVSDFKCVDSFELALSLKLPKLRELVINPVGSSFTVTISQLELSGTPELERLSCVYGAEFAEIDLSHVPRLKKLYSGCIPPLTDWDFSCVPELEELNCNGCDLGEIELSEAKNLMWLICDENELVTLEVSSLLELIHLNCSDNPIEALDLRGNPSLQKLVCNSCKLQVLDLSMNTQLEFLSCNDNKLTRLDLEHVPFLEVLCCQGNVFEEIDIRSLNRLKVFQCDAQRVLHRSDQDLKQMMEWPD